MLRYGLHACMQEIEEWQKRVVVDDPVFRATLHQRPKPSQTDRLAHVLQVGRQHAACSTWREVVSTGLPRVATPVTGWWALKASWL